MAKTTRRHSTDAERRQILARFRQSKLPVRQFCKQQRVGLATLRRWEKRFSPEPAGGAFVEIAPPKEVAPPAPRCLAELELPGGLRLRIHG